MTAPDIQRIAAGDIHLQVTHWPGDGNPALLLHATGFHGRCWDEVIRHLHRAGVQPPIYAVDLRGHGGSDKTPPPFSWQLFGNDIIALVDALNLDQVTAIGHSMGGHLLVLAAAERPDRFRQLLLLDPVIMPEAMVAMMDSLPEDFEHPTARRRNQWSGPDEMRDSFARKPPFDRWEPAVLDDYCQHGLVQVGDHFELACPPAIESRIYLCSGNRDIYRAMPRVTCPVHIIRARDPGPADKPLDFGPSTTFAGIGDRFTRGSETQWQEASHFLPMEQPARVAEIMQGLITGR